MQTYAVDLAGHVALVTGAARNLPAVVAKEFAAAGASVAINYRHSEEMARTMAEDIRRAGGHTAVFQADVTRRDDLTRMVPQVQAELGTIDILVNGAGPFTLTPFMELPEAEWDRIMDTNLKAIYLLTQRVAPGMMEQGWGRIINISSGSADLRGQSAYSLAKHGVRALTEALALELGPAITVNAVAPGQIEESAPDVSAIDPTYVARTIEKTVTNRLVQRQEIARMMVLMCSSVFDSVTGRTLVMDGGKSIPRW
jgi:NAD(P)-dependent dehydrogenase (short-subunit alcohol dehydrogenase family)